MNIKNITNFVSRTDSLNSYLKEISKIPPYTAQEEKEKFIAYHNSNDENEKLQIRNDIILRNQRFVFAIAKRYDASGNLTCDLVSVGNMGLFEAFEEFDYTRGFRFYSYAAWFVHRAVSRYFLREHLMVRPTNNVKIAAKVKKVKNEFFLKNGREPSTVEIIDILGEKYNIIVTDPTDVCGAKIEYIDANISDDADSSTFEECQEWNVNTASQNDYVKKADNESLSFHLNEALNLLKPMEKQIIMMAFGLGDYQYEYKDDEIGFELGYTSERIRQIKHEAIKKLKKSYNFVTAKA